MRSEIGISELIGRAFREKYATLFDGWKAEAAKLAGAPNRHAAPNKMPCGRP